MKDELSKVFNELMELGLHFDLEVFAFEGKHHAYSALVEVPSIETVRQVADIAEKRGLRIHTANENRLRIDTPETA
jgi:hypothetical protein